jgi:ribosomal protein S18 acetylase RimI-like enzyme
MIRTATPADAAFVTQVGVSSGLFPAEASFVTDGMMSAYFQGKEEEGHICLVDEIESPEGGRTERVAMAYVEPVRATDGTWELLMIAVDPRHQGQGRGRALVDHVECLLAGRGQRLLLVQTSGDDGYARTRDFYRQSAYDEVARAPDYYASGVDMVMFRKRLAGGDVAVDSP